MMNDEKILEKLNDIKIMMDILEDDVKDNIKLWEQCKEGISQIKYDQKISLDLKLV